MRKRLIAATFALAALGGLAIPAFASSTAPAAGATVCYSVYAQVNGTTLVNQSGCQ